MKSILERMIDKYSPSKQRFAPLSTNPKKFAYCIRCQKTFDIMTHKCFHKSTKRLSTC